ncbi:hypothetical protein N0V93_005502 [Gnomoniopsis smithogilvyi]|uniref:Polyketide synthase n=1 Tax=Gnomoniopsis smithogilvyi TaxID=1191159 RepID=A0A9W8YSZ7_9PEZI|nr:hypothetical protein N0V93_005502 [Gnomoniopsis smithogilvyi]
MTTAVHDLNHFDVDGAPDKCRYEEAGATSGNQADAPRLCRSPALDNGVDCNAAKAGDEAFQQFTPIAICGMACRLPGGIHSPKDLWDFLMLGGDARTRVPASRYNVAAFHCPTQKAGHVISEYGYFLDETTNIGALDTSMFPMARSELETLDPQQKLLLEVTRESIDDAGEVGWRGTNIGVYVGSFGNDWYDVMQRESQRHGAYYISGCHDYALSNHVSYEMDLRGPSMTIRTACSSSLVSLSEACAAISKGDCRSAIVGGTSIVTAPSLVIDETNTGTLSPDGSCKTFSSKADGYSRGEGIVALYIKPLNHALRDGNPIRAVIVGAATNCDGRTPGFTVPSSDAQESLIRHTYRIAGISESNILKTGFIECHGTGTQRGDITETTAIGKVFAGTDFVHIGSIKPNLGHGEGVSGLTAVLKAVLSLEHQTILPNIKCLPFNTDIPLLNGPLVVPQEATQWPKGRAERVSINSFGIGGSNAHIIVDSAKMCGYNSARSTRRPTETPQLLVYSAESIQSLKEMSERYNTYLEDIPQSIDIADVAYTLASRREHLSFRSFTVRTRHDSGFTSPPISQQSKVKVATIMVFTGQGAQWAQIGRELLRNNPVFSQTIRSLDSHLQSLGPAAPDWKLEEELLRPSRTTRVNDAEFSQPLCTALQIALVDSFASIGVEPTAVVGHSSGEIAAAYTAHGLTSREAIIIAFYRGLLSKLQTRSGAMAAVNLGCREVKKFLIPGTVMACDNSPNSVTISGDAERVESVLREIKRMSPAVLTTTLNVGKAYHSDHMAEIGGQYHRAMTEAGIKGGNPVIPFFSSVYGGPICTDHKPQLVGGDIFGPRYWQKNLESPVLFKDAVSSLIDHTLSTSETLAFLEIGPHGALAGPLRQTVAGHPSTIKEVPQYISTMSRRKNSQASFLTAVGKLWMLGANVDFNTLIPQGKCVPDLPRYPWYHPRSYGNETRAVREWRFRKYPHHDLLGARVPESSDIEPIWRNLLHLDSVPWIRDHKIRTDIIFPFAAYVAMAAEGAYQVSGIPDAVELRNVVVATALVLTEREPAELLTSLRRSRLTDSADSRWFEFTISAYNGHVWTKHCHGQVCAVKKLTLHGDEVLGEEKATHDVDVRQWYERASRGGLRYGPRFRTMQQIKTTASGFKGSGWTEISNDWPEKENAQYHLHPVILDTFPQIAGAAAHHGFTHAYRQAIPSRMDYIALIRCASDRFTLSANCAPVDDAFVGNGMGRASPDSVPCLKVSGAHLSPIDSTEDNHEDALPITARCEWVPHIDFMDLNALIKSKRDHAAYFNVLEMLGQAAISLYRRLSDSVSPANGRSNTQKYVTWLHQQEFPLMEHLDDSDLLTRIHDLNALVANGPAEPAATAITKLCLSATAILSEKKEALEILHHEEVLANFLRFLNKYDVSEFLRCQARSQPGLRILEIGTGLGPSVDGLLDHIRLPGGQLLYSQYVYTEKSTVPLQVAKVRYKDFPNMEFAVLDIAQDLADQGFQGRQFDLVLANGALNTTKSLHESLRHVRALIHDSGRLLFQQPRGLAWTNFVLGALPHWWCGSESGQTTGPSVEVTGWDEALRVAGFRGMAGEVPDAPDPFHLNTVMLARPDRESHMPKSKSITILHGMNDPSSLKALIEVLQLQGFHPSCCTIESTPADRDIIAVLDDSGPFFDRIEESAFYMFRDLIERINNSGSGIFWISKPTQTFCKDPRYAPVVGLARTLRAELGVNFATCEVDDMTSSATLKAVANVFQEFHGRSPSGFMDLEFSITADVTRVNRIFPSSLHDGNKPSSIHHRAAMKISRPGRLESLHWVEKASLPLASNEIEIEVHAVALNFRDVLEALGSIPCADAGRIAASEASGVVHRVGCDVTEFQVGDRVVAIGSGACSTLMTTTESLCEKLPNGISFTQGASMPIVFATAIYALMNTGRLQQGQSVLIHSGCGGVGLAAIQIAKMLGAVIYTTVSSEEKATHLTDTLGIPRQHIFTSRTTSFYDGIMRETVGKGVDLVLNSLSGDLLHATWRCVAKFGMMIEIGKVDLLGAGKLDMDVFLANRSYCCFDLRQLIDERPEVVHRLLQSTMLYHQQGHIRPIELAKVDVASNAQIYQNTLRYMQRGKHIGKIILSMFDQDGLPALQDTPKPHSPTAKLDPSASYLLVGGLGGLGRSVSVWMVQHGARNLTFLSRSIGEDPEGERGFVRMLASMGCAAYLVRGSVTNLADVARAVDGSPKPLRGVIHMAMVLRDQSFGRMTVDEWDSVVRPKVEGTWNLHIVTQEKHLELDFFILFSSLSGVLGQPGQGHYAAASTFLDAFAQYRMGLGLPCTSLDIGAMEGVGYLTGNRNLLNKMRGMGWQTVKEEQLLDALEWATMPPMTGTSHQAPWLNDPGFHFTDTNRVLIGVAPDASTGNNNESTRLQRDCRLSAYLHIRRSNINIAPGSSSSDSLRKFLNETKHTPDLFAKPETATRLAHEIYKKLSSLLLKKEEEPDLTLSLSELGLDSLLAVELRAWFKHVFAVEVSVLEMLAMGTLEILGKKIAERLADMYGS